MTLLFRRGYTPLVSVIPPNAPLSPNSRIQADQRGKVPGIKYDNGTWGGYSWLTHDTTADDVKRWSHAGANIGLRTELYPVIDVDVLDAGISKEVVRIARRVLGDAPVRVGNAPKALLLYRSDTPFPNRMAIRIKVNDEVHIVEVLGTGRQAVVEGTHPSGNRYRWTEVPLRDSDGLQKITEEQVVAFFDEVKSALEVIPGVQVDQLGTLSGDRDEVDQDALEAPSKEALAAALDAIPNDDTFAPDRETYVKMGYAIKAASGEEDGYPLFALWAAKHESDGRVAGNPETWRYDWDRMLPPYSIGWGWIAEVAKRYGHMAEAEYEFGTFDPEVLPDRGPPEYSDPWLVEKVIGEYGSQLRYVPLSGKWNVWSDNVWAPDAVLLADHLVSQSLQVVARRLAKQGSNEKEKAKNAAKAVQLCSAHRLREVRQLLRADPRCSARPESFDNDQWALNTPGGIVNLRDGVLSPPDADAMCSKQTSCTPDFAMKTPHWEAFLEETTGGDQELQDYLQRLAGYCLTGSTSEQTLHFIYGSGGNGKSVFLTVLTDILKDYGTQAPMDTFTASKHDRHPTDLAGLVGARMVSASETQGGRRWDEQRIKTLTGGDKIRARFMRQDFFTFPALFKLLFVGNHKPALRDIDDAIRRRIHMVPFVHTPKVVDTNLIEGKLTPEFPGILAWMIVGCMDWQDRGLQAPESVRSLTEQYFQEEDPTGRWLEESCNLEEPDAFYTTADLFQNWTEWANTRGEYVGSIKRFSQALEAHKYEKDKDPKSRRNGFRGITPIQEDVFV